MKRSTRKAAVFSCVLALTALLACPSVTAESKPSYQAQTVLENQYDAVVEWNNGALFIKNGSVDSITSQTSMKLVKPDGTVSDLANSQKFDKIYSALSDPSDQSTDLYYSGALDSDYLVVGKDGKKALLKDDGSFVDNALYEDILSVTDNFMAVQEDGAIVVRKMGDSTPVAEYPESGHFYLHETPNSLFVVSGGQIVGMFDQNLQPIDLSKYEKVWDPSSAYGDYVLIVSQKGEGVLSDTGREIVPPEYSGIFSFTYQNRTYFYADVIANKEIQSFVIYQDDGTVFASGDGSLIGDPLFALDDTGGYAILTTGNTCGIYDFNSRTVKIDPVYPSILDLDDHCFAYKQNGQVGVKTYDNRDILQPGAIGGSIRHCYIGGGRIIVDVDDPGSTDKNPKCTAYIYSVDTGKLLAKTDQYAIVEKYSGGAARTESDVGNGFRYGLLDENGDEIVSPEAYDYLESIDTERPNGKFYIVVKDNKVGIIDSEGSPVVDVSYQSLGDFNVYNKYNSNIFLFENSKQEIKNFYVCAEYNDKWGLLELSPIVYADGLSLDKTEAALHPGDTLTLKPSISPANAANPKVDWSSSDESVASVKDGTVTARKAGTATITAKMEDGGFTAACTITVSDENAATGTSNTAPTNTTTRTASSETASSMTDAAGSPATGESPVTAGASATLLIASALAVVISKKKA